MAAFVRILQGFLVCAAWFNSVSVSVAAGSTLRVGIIGSGAGGSSAAYHLSKLLNNNVQIDVFEEKPIVGGRMATVNIMGNEYETGASIIHPKNKLAVELSAKFGLVQRSASTPSLTTIFKNGEYVFSTSSWTIITIYKIFQRYGFDFNRLQAATSKFIEEFSKIYTLQDKGTAFETVEAMISGMSPILLGLTRSDFQSFLIKEGFAPLFIEELVQAITYVNYGQNITGLHSLVGSVSVAGASGGLWSVLGGNKRLAIELLNNSYVNLKLSTRVGAVVKLPDGSFQFSTDSAGKHLLPGIYDKVILAIPFTERSPIQFVNFDASLNALASGQTRKYHRTVSTIVAAASVTAKYNSWIDILACTPNYFTSISRIFPVVLNRSEKVPVFKIFSPQPLTETQLKEIFVDIHQIDIADWLAYPDYDAADTVLPSFIPAPNVYHLNGIEWAASAIEMSLISGRNAAIHISNQISGAAQRKAKVTGKKTEL